ncbi:right-handed parallel beta-helix repeat-containing protein [Ruegeria sp.]|uniref:right-handed parallel beta-helix repeat-containing protein n=1 Tax=Ruegeria sp. TaxID=1879320 RepID=UPI003B5A6DE0
MSTTIIVTSKAELDQALSQAQGGETILLQAGDYGRLNINTQYASNVTIKSADPNAPAEISELRVNGASNVTFEDVTFDYTFNGEPQSYRPFQIQNSSNITIKNSTFDGDLASGVSSTADGYGTGYGLYIRGSSSVTVDNNEFYNWRIGIASGISQDVAITGNNIHSIRADGIFIDANKGILIEGNYLHDFNRSLNSGDHADFIQFSKINGPSSDITIRENVIDMGSGDYAQAIFLGNAGTDPNDPNLFYTNVLIEDNMIYNAHTHGISLGSAQDVNISNNTVLAVPGLLTGGVSIPAIRVGGTSQNVTIDHNVTSDIIGYSGQSSWNLTGNVYVQNTNPSGPNYYGDLFIFHATGAQDGYNQFGVQPGSIIDTTGAGSDLAYQFPLSYDSWVGTSTTGSTGSNTSTTSPDTGTTNPDTSGTAPSTDTTNTDTSGTDTTDTGSSSSSPDTGGTDTTTTSPDTDTGSVSPLPSTTNPDSGDDTSGTTAEQPETMVFDDFVLDIAGLPGNDQASLKGDTFVADTGSGPALQFDGKDDYVNIGKLPEFGDSGQIAFTVEYSRDEADGSSQRLVWNHTKVGLTITGDGLIAHVGSDDVKFHKGFASGDIGLNDTESHTITVLVDEDADRLQVLVDGEVVIDETSVDFDFSGGRDRAWTLGTAWGRDVDGEITAFAIDDDVQFVDTWVPDDAMIA